MRRRIPARTLAAVALAVAAAGWAAPSVASAAPRQAVQQLATHDDEFEGISCTTAKGCLAVGSRFSSATKELYALGETRSPGSSTWAVHDPPLVAGATTTAFGPIGNGETVSCVSSPSAVCMGIGSYNKTPGGQFNYAAEWNWSGWKIVNPPDPSPTNSSGLDAVRCVSSSFCIAVGHWFDTSAGKDELESLVWNGKSWALKKMPPVPANAASPRLWGLSCISKTWCMAVGDYDVGSSQPLLSEVWNGKSWVMHLPPSPAGQSSGSLLGVSCASTKFCNAVGDSLTTKLAFVSLGEVWNGKSWTVKPTPAGKQKIGSTLFDVSCQSAKVCLAVGNLAAQWNGTSWTSVPFPVPPGKSTITNAVSLSCLSANDCTGAGGYSTLKQGTLTLIWNWNGKSFSLQPAKNP
jgi:hypothetical protein